MLILKVAVNMDMKVAGSTLSNNIVGKAQLNTVFETTFQKIISFFEDLFEFYKYHKYT